MLSHNLKRYLSLFLSFLMVFSLMPVSAWAAEEDLHEHSHEVIEETTPDTQDVIATEEPTVEEPAGDDFSTEPNPEIVRFQEMIDEILATYAGSAALTVEEGKAAAEALSDESCEEAWYEIMVLEEEMNFAHNDALVNEAELEALVSANLTMDAFIGVITSKVVAPSVSFFATTVSPIEGVSVTDSSSTGSLSNGTVTITAKGGWFSSSRTTNTITVANTSGKPGKLSFDYTLSNHYGTTLPSAQGSYLSDMAEGGSYEFTITSKGSSSTATLTLSNFQFEVAKETSNVTIEYNAALGSVTAAGETVSSGTTIDAVSLADGVALVATPNESTFLGWVNKTTHEIVSTSATFTFKPLGDSTVVAAFAKADAPSWFKIGTKLYDDLSAACASGGTVVLAHDGTLPAGDYTIPAGATLLIPYDAANTLCTTKPVPDYNAEFLNNTANAWVTPTAYRTLNMAQGANIVINGAMSISGKSCVYQENNGCPTGPLGFVNMASGSSITVNSGAKLYVWGYITGSGAVTVKSGGTVYEDFQVRDWRGGTAAFAMIDKTEKVFPVSQYYVQNVEVPMTLEAGALEYCYMSLIATRAFGETTVPFIGGSGMFQNSGTIVKDYIETADRLEVQINGNLTMSNLNLKISVYNMNSANYVLPITNNLTVRVNSGTTTISQDMCMLPGSKIIVGKNATVQLASGSNLYVYDLDEWSGKLFVYPAKNVSPLKYVGGKKGAPVGRSLSDATIVVNGTLDASAGFLYTTTGGANITSEGGGQVATGTPGGADVTYQATQSGTDIAFAKVPITPAKLLNKDTSYQETTTPKITYTYTDGKWICDTEVNEHTFGEDNVCTVCGYEKPCEHNYGAGVVTSAPTCEGPGVKTYTCSNCGDSYTESIAATGHTAGAAATCTTAQTCTVCGATLQAALGHTAGAAATCTTAQTCTVCSAELVAALGHTEVTDAAVAATCTETGLTEGKHCSVCNEVLVAQEEVAALGHTEVIDAAVEATCTETGLTEGKHCSVCGEILTAQEEVAALGHTWVGTKCTVCGLFKLYATSLRAGDYLDMYFYVKASDLTADQNYYAHIEKTFADGRGSVIRDIDYLNEDGTQNWEIFQNDYLRFSFDDISAKEMTDEIHVTIYDENGNPVSTTTTETIQSYAVRLLRGLTGDGLSQKNQYLRTALIDMLNYGAAAQDKFSYNKGDLADAGCDAYQKYATAEVTCDADETDTSNGLDSVSVIADNGLTLCLFFNNLNGVDRTDLTASVSYTNHYGNEVSWTTSSFNTIHDNLVGVDIVGLAIADGRQLITCKVINSNNEVLASGTYSIERYLASNLPEHKVFPCLMKFIDSAYKYFHN